MQRHSEQRPSSMSGDSANDHSDKTMPLGVGDVIDESAIDPLANAGEGKKFNSGSLVLMVVVIIACAGLWFMKSLSKVSAASGGNAEVEATIDKFIKSLDTSPSKKNGPSKPSASVPGVLAVLSESYTERQVPLDNVQRDPFIITDMPVLIPGNQGGATSRQAEKRAIFERAAGRLELKSVIMSSQPLANISGKIVRRGEELVAGSDGVAFRVAQITQDAVTLAAEDEELDLHLTFVLTLKR